MIALAIARLSVVRFSLAERTLIVLAIARLLVCCFSFAERKTTYNKKVPLRIITLGRRVRPGSESLREQQHGSSIAWHAANCHQARVQPG
jgi:hypothetical protein